MVFKLINVDKPHPDYLIVLYIERNTKLVIAPRPNKLALDLTLRLRVVLIEVTEVGEGNVFLDHFN